MLRKTSILIMFLLIASCATKRHVSYDVYGDYGARGMGTYNIVTEHKSDTEGWLEEAIAESLNDKGYSKSTDMPDFLVEYKIIQTTMTRENPSPGNVPVSGGSASGAYYGRVEASANVWIVSIDLTDPTTGRPFVESTVRVTTTKQDIDKNMAWLIEPIMKDIPMSGDRFDSK